MTAEFSRKHDWSNRFRSDAIHHMPAIRSLIVALAALLAASTADLAPAVARDQPGEFDFYVLALSIAPSFCDLTGYRKHKAQCDHPSDADYRETPLTIHGLWPNRLV